jgi:hypothetical protein
MLSIPNSCALLGPLERGMSRHGEKSDRQDHIRFQVDCFLEHPEPFQGFRLGLQRLRPFGRVLELTSVHSLGITAFDRKVADNTV